MTDISSIPITVSGYRFDRVAGLGIEVPVPGFDVTYEPAAIGDMNTHVLVGPRTREVSEIGMLPYLLAVANDDFGDYVLIPVFPLRLFRHKSIFVRVGAGIERPEDLRGRRVGTSGYSSTSLTWIRGMLQHQYGVAPSDLHWVLSDEDSAIELAGERSANEMVLPDGIDASTGTPGKSESDLLVDGEVDVLFHAAEPEAYVRGDSRVARLFADSRAAEQGYFQATGIFPIMHAVAVRCDVVADHPDLPVALTQSYAVAKHRALQRLRAQGWAMISLPWLAQEEEATRRLMGEDFWPYGIETNRTTLDTLLQYAAEQGLTTRRLTIEELFHPSTLDWVDHTPGPPRQ
ncbi:MAG: ABC transporter substrate-binding protein [Acidimicrobiia bacterium]|nr:ABC transporter substrate-binding protein [Acidimicrobiia bacterium]